MEGIRLRGRPKKTKEVAEKKIVEPEGYAKDVMEMKEINYRYCIIHKCT